MKTKNKMKYLIASLICLAYAWLLWDNSDCYFP